MKKISIILFAMLIIACSSDSNDSSVETAEDPRMASSAITNIYATGKVAEQSAEQAKKTIFGKWDLGSSSSQSARENVNCSFSYIEFTEDDYLMGLYSSEMPEDQQNIVVYGTFDMIEVNQKVTSIKLKTFYEGQSVDIASVTGIEVKEVNGALDISFNFNFTTSMDNIGVPCSNDLSKDYAAEKEAAMDATLTADITTNHYKVVGNWTLSDISEIDQDGQVSQDFADMFTNYCEDKFEDDFNDGIISTNADYEEFLKDCKVPNKSVLKLTTFGSYVFMDLKDDEIIEAEIGVWSWTDDSQTKITVGQPGEDQATTGTLVSVSESQLIFTFDEMDYDYDTGQIIQYQITYTFTK
jgi:hypothetical protein